MIIVSGHLFVGATDRAAYLAGCDEVMRLARAAPGCVDFQVTADPLEPDRINVFEQWESAESAAAFRGSGPSGEQQAAIRDARVFEHEIARSQQL